MARALAVLRSFLPFLIGLPILYGLQLFLGSWSPAMALIAVTMGVNVVLAVSLNVVNGFTGQFSLGHAGFMAVGAYTAAKITLALNGLVLPGLTRIHRELTPFAATGLLVIMIGAVVVTVTQGPAAAAILPFVVGCLCALVAHRRSI